MDIISYKEIISLFDDEWDFSYLTYDEMMEVLNFPVKMGNNHLERLVQNNDIPTTAHFLIVVKHTIDYDYSLNLIFRKKCEEHFINIKLGDFWCNYKYAVVKAGLGQYAKNSLVYHNKFQFDTHFAVFIIFNPIIDLPKRELNNFALLDQCKNCFDCQNACPVSAIHYNNDNNYAWIDMNKCDNFCFFGNHNKIPSIKLNHYLLQELSLEEKRNICSYKDLHQIFPNIILSPGYIDNNEIHYIQYPTCRECTSQKKCTRYGGNYPYDKAKPHLII